MICKNCGAQNAEGIKFCKNCGTPINDTDLKNSEAFNTTDNTNSYSVPPKPEISQEEKSIFTQGVLAISLEGAALVGPYLPIIGTIFAALEWPLCIAALVFSVQVKKKTKGVELTGKAKTGATLGRIALIICIVDIVISAITLIGGLILTILATVFGFGGTILTALLSFLATVVPFLPSLISALGISF